MMHRGALSVSVEETIEVATVTGLPLAPFVSMRDGSVDALAVNKLASFGRRCGYADGWVRGLNYTFVDNAAPHKSTSSPQPTPDDAGEPATEQEGTARWNIHKSGKTVFLAGQLVVIDAADTYVPRRLDETCTVRCSLAACGNTSYTVVTEVFILAGADDAADVDETQRLGYTAQTFVNIDVSQRKPCPIGDEAKARAHAALQAHQTVRSGLSRAPRSMAQMQRIVPRECKPIADDTTPHFTFRSIVRPFADFDFNGHVNQGVFASVALDAIYALVKYGGDGVVPQLRALAKHRELHVHTIRVDYLHEVTNPAAELRADLWYAPAIDAEFVDSAAIVGAPVPIWFEVTEEGQASTNAHGIIVLLE